MNLSNAVFFAGATTTSTTGGAGASSFFFFGFVLGEEFDQRIVNAKSHQWENDIRRRQNITGQSVKCFAQKMRIHKQSIRRTNRKTYVGNDGVFDGLVDDDAHFLNYEL